MMEPDGSRRQRLHLHRRVMVYGNYIFYHNIQFAKDKIHGKCFGTFPDTNGMYGEVYDKWIYRIVVW